MKKFLLIAVATLAIMSCKKDPTPTADLIYNGDTEITIAEGTSFCNITFEANAAWEAQIEVDTISTGAKAARINKTSGTAGSQTIRVEFEDLEKDQKGRFAVVGVSTAGFDKEPAEGKFFMVIFYQGKVFAILPINYSVEPKGGEVSGMVYTNCKQVALQSPAEKWISGATYADKKVKATIAENVTYDGRAATLDFKVKDYEEGKEVTFSMPVEQSGLNFTKCANELTKIFTSTSTVLSQAVCGGKFYVCNGAQMFEVTDKGTTLVNWPAEVSSFTYKAITNDDAGNLIITNHTTYDTGASAYTDGNFYLAVKNANGTSLKITKAAWELGGPVGAKIKVTGDITNNAMVSFAVDGIVDVTGSNSMGYWQVTNGTFGDYTKVAVTGFTGISWLAGYWYGYANWMPNFVALGATPADGFVMSGVYDENCLYDVTSAGAATKKMNSVYMCGSDDCTANFSVQSIDIRTIGGVKYLAVLASPQFPSWGWDGSSFPIVALHKLADITTTSDVFSSAKFCKVIKTSGVTDIQPAGEITLFADGNNIGIMFSDLNGDAVQVLSVDPAKL